MEILIYFKTIVFVSVLWACGFTIVRRICRDLRIQLLLPLGVAAGIGLYIFLLNLGANFIKGEPLFYTVLILEILLAYFLKKKIHPPPLIYPVKKERIIWIASLIFWTVFLYYISATGHALSGDWQNHTILASLFRRGDFPIHAPFQPDRLSSYHIGGALILGALKTTTGASYAFLGSVVSFVMLLSLSQILQWILNINAGGWRSILFFLIPVTALISFGNFMFFWPYSFDFSSAQAGIFSWIGKLPGLYTTFDPFGAAVSLDALNLFIHRMIALALFAALLPLVLYPNLKNKLAALSIITVLFGSVALADETILIIGAGAVALVSFITLFKKNLAYLLLFCGILVIVIIFQGGLINEVLFKSDRTIAKFLLLADDVKGPTERFTPYRSYRIKQESSKLLTDEEKYYPLRFFHFGARWQALALFAGVLVLTFMMKKQQKSHDVLLLIWLFTITSAISLLAYYVIVPPGWSHINGNRFLALSYQMSGIGIIVIFILFFLFAKGSRAIMRPVIFSVKILLIFLLLGSILPQFAHLFPREKYNWFKVPFLPQKEELKWVEKNLKVNNRIMAFMERHPTGGGLLELAREVGIFVPAWYEKPETQGFEVSPAYLDLFRTLNPEIFNNLKAEYIMVNNDYLSVLPPERLADLENPGFFQPVFQTSDRQINILKILPNYLNSGKNYTGTYYELMKILPDYGSVFVDGPPEITQSVWRVIFLILQAKNLEVYYNPAKCCVFYNFIINVDLEWWGDKSAGPFDYLVLGPKTDPALICNCKAELYWEDFGKDIKVWKTI